MFQNKKLWISIALATVLFVTALLGFIIIPNVMNKFKAASSMGDNSLESVSGNGGSAVMVGEYLYFTDGFKSKTEYKYKENNYNKVRKNNSGAIWRVRMANGVPTYDNSYLTEYLSDHEADFPNWEKELEDSLNFTSENENTEIFSAINKQITDEKGADRMELVVPKIAGWESTALWVFGNNLIYTSPNNQKNRHGELQRERIDFFRCDLRGRNHQKIYTTKTETLEAKNYTVTWAGQPYLIVKDGERLVRVDMKGNVKTITEKCADAKMPVVSSYYNGTNQNGEQSLENSYGGIMGYVFYTENADTDEIAIPKGNKVFNYNIAENVSTLLLQDQNYRINYALNAFGNGQLMFSRTNSQLATDNRLFVTSDPMLPTTNAFYPLQPTETQIFTATERTTDKFRYITYNEATDLRVYEMPDGVSTDARNHTLSEIIPVTNFSKIHAVTTSDIVYEDTEGNIITVDYRTGEEVSRTTLYDKNALARVSVFRNIDRDGNPRTGVENAYMVFFIKDLTEIGAHDNMETTEETHDHGAHSITAGTLVSTAESVAANGMIKEYLLARLDIDKYVTLPSIDDQADTATTAE